MFEFSSLYRLKNADDFSSVFSLKRHFKNEFFTIYYKHNPEQLNSRLGLIVSKKIHKRANKRNYMRRLIKEQFRLHEIRNSQFDLIVRVNKLYEKQNFHYISKQLQYCFNQILKNAK